MIDWNAYSLSGLKRIPQEYNIERDFHEDGVRVSWAEMRLYMGLTVALSNIESLANKIEELEDIIRDLEYKVRRIQDVD